MFAVKPLSEIFCCEYILHLKILWWLFNGEIFLVYSILNCIVSLVVTVTVSLSCPISLKGGINRDYSMKRGIEFSTVEGDAITYGADLQRYDLGMDYHVLG